MIATFLLLLCSLMLQAQPKEPKLDKYWFVLLKKGEQQVDSATKAQWFNSHFSNMQAMAEKGVLKVVGPFDKNDHNWSGIFIYHCSREELDIYLNQDKTIKNGYFKTEIALWYTEASGSFAPKQTTKPTKAKKQTRTKH